jgi:hypothetical protein
MLKSTQVVKNMLKLVKEKTYWNVYKCDMCYTGDVRAHPTWNLKTALGPKPCKVNQQYQHTNVNQHVLAEEIPNRS